EGELTDFCDEGELEWVPFHKVANLPMAEGDRRIFNHVLTSKRLLFGTFSYTNNYELIDFRLDPSPGRYFVREEVVKMTEKEQEQETKLVVITVMSGAGKTVAIQSFEDLGYYCVDNLPPTLLPKFLELMKDSANNIYKVALVMDLRGREFFDSLFESLDVLSDE